MTISNLKITKGTSNIAANCYVGFFGYTNSPATITNLTINNVDITGSLYVGAIVGYGFTGKEISNCHVTGDIEIEGWWYIGGIGGNGYVSTVSGCTVEGNDGSYIKALNDGSYVGGIWGYRGEGSNVIANSTVSNIDISGTDRIGGICGIAHYQNTIEGCTIEQSSITATNDIGNVGLIAGANLGNTANGPALLLNNKVDVTTSENFTLEDQIVENPPMLGDNDHTGSPSSAAIVGDVERDSDGKITDATLTVVGTDKNNVDLNSKLPLADGLAFYPNSDGTVKVYDDAGYVASIGDRFFTSFDDALAEVQSGETITLLADISTTTVEMDGFGIATWNNTTLTATEKINAVAGENVLSGNVESAQLMLEGLKGENRTLTIAEASNVDLYIKGKLDDGLLDVGFGLSKQGVVTGDQNERVYYAKVLVAGDVSVEKYDADGNASSGAIYIRPYSELVVTGNLDVVGEVHNRGSLVVDGGTMKMSVWATPKLLGYTTGDSMTVTNNGTMTVSGASAVTFGEASASNQHISVDAQYADGMFATISNGGKFEADTLAFANAEGVTLTVTGEDSLFRLYSADGRTVTGGYTYAWNKGKIVIADNAAFDVSELANDNFENSGSFDVAGSAAFATLTNTDSGTINATGSTLTSTATISNSGTIRATGSTLKLSNSGAGKFTNAAGATLTLDDSILYRISYSFGTYGVKTLENAGTISMTNGSLLYGVTLNNTGTIAMDYTSTLGFTNYSDDSGTGSVTIDTTGYNGGAYLLIDNGKWTAEQYEDLLGSWNDSYMVVNGDLLLSNADMTRFYVNTAWADLEDYSAIEGYDKVYYGLNGYDIGSTAILDAINSGSDVTVYLESDAGVVSGGHLGVVWRLNNNTVTITSDEERTLTLPIGQVSSSGFYIEGNGNLIFDKNITVHWKEKNGIGDQSFYFGSLAGSDTVPVMEVKGTMIVDQSFNIGEYQVEGLSDAAGELILHDGASMSVGEQFVMRGNGAVLDLKEGATASFNYATLYGGELNATGATLESTSYVYLGWYPRSEADTSYGTKFAMNLTGSTFTVGTDLTVSHTNSAGASNTEYQGVVNLNDSDLIVNGAFASDQTINLANGSALNLKGSAANSGTINVADSTLTAEQGIANTGTVYFQGNNEFKDAITGNGVVQYVGEGNILTGAVSAREFIVGLEGSDSPVTSLTISGGAAVEVTGGGNSGRIGFNTNVVISGDGTTFTDNANLTMDESATLTISDKAEVTLGYFATGGKTDVTDATLNLTGGSGSAGASAIGGLNNVTEFNVNAGGVVNVMNGLLIGHRETKDGLVTVNEGGELNVSGGTLYVSGLVNNKDYDTQGNGTLNIKGGTVNVTNGAGVEIGDENRIANGAVNIEGGELTASGSDVAIYSTGSLNVTNGTVRTQSINNAGTISLDYTSTLAFGAITSTGTITVDTAEFSSGIYKILDYTGTGTYTEDQYRTLLDNNWNDSYSVVNNDLYLTNLDGSEERYVNIEWKGLNPYDEVTFVDGTKAYYGLNAFDTVSNALALPNGVTSYDNPIRLNVTGDIEAITVVGKNVTEVNTSAKPADFTEDSVIDEDAIVVNLVDINNTNAGWQVYYALESGCDAKVYGNITTNYLSSTFTTGSQTGDPNFSGAGYAGTTATVYGNTTVNIGKAGAANDALYLNTWFLLGAGGGTVNGDSTLNIYSGTIEADALVGGGAWGGLVKGNSSVTISGGEITLLPEAYSAVYGGSYGYANPTSAETRGTTSVTITGDAKVTGKVIGGSDKTAVASTTVKISGSAQVDGNVYGGGNRGGAVTGGTNVSLTDTATVSGNVFGGGDNSNVDGDTKVVVDGTEVVKGIFGGSLNGNAGNTVVDVSNFTRLQPVPGTQSDKIQIVGGGMAEAGKSSTTASTNVTVSNSKIYGDVVAGSSATGTDAIAVSGNSVVNVTNLEINGYSEGSNIWTGRVFGAGRAQYGGSVVTESTDVTIENMSGYTYDSDGNIIDGSNKGARVYGAGQAYASMSRVEVGETKLRISGDETNISEIYGGGIVSGTEVQEKAAFQIVGKTDVEITGGTVTDVIVGGNNTNWFGSTVIGVDAGDGTYQAAEGEYGIKLVIGGSTKVSDGSVVAGGSYVDYAYEYQKIVDGVDAYGRTAEIYGNTYMELTGDSVISTDVFGGSFAYYEQVDFSADVSKLSAPSATQYGDVTVVVSGNTAIAGSVYGGGAAVTNTDQVKTTSVTNGNVSITISGGTVGGDVYAGGYNAEVTGDAVVTLTGGTVAGGIHGNGEENGTVAGTRTLNLGASDAAFYTTTLSSVTDFNTANIVNANVTVDGTFSATEVKIAEATLTLNSGFDAATENVTIDLSSYNVSAAALVLGSAAGVGSTIALTATSALTENRYLIATGISDTSAFALDASLEESYILRTVGDNVYLYNGAAPYFSENLTVTQAVGASVNGNYSYTADFKAEGLLSGYTVRIYDSATATTPYLEIPAGADADQAAFELSNTIASFWISVTANGENGLSTDSERIEYLVKDYDSPVILSVSSEVTSNSVKLICGATDNFGVTSYEFILDGQSLGSQSSGEFLLDGSTLAAGTHTYSVNVFDAAGNLAMSADQSFEFTPEPGPTLPATFLYSSLIPINNGESMTVYANYSDPSAALEYRIGESGEWLAYDAAAGVTVSSSTTIYFREQGISDPVETGVDVRIVPVGEEVNSEIIQLAPTTETVYEATYNFADGTSKTVELSDNTVEHYAFPEETTVTIVEKDETGTVVNTIVEETPVAVTTSTVPDQVVAVDDGHDNLFFAMSIGKWDRSISAQHQGDGIWGGTREIVSLSGKNRFSTVFTGGADATILFLTDDANGDVFFLDDVYTANGTDARISRMSEIRAGAGDDIVDLTSERFSYEEHVGGQLIVRGGDGNDILWGNAGTNILFGDAGNDKITGGSGNDILIGGSGNDTLHGGGGDDIFCYGSDYDWGKDTIIQLSGSSVTLYMDGVDMNDCKISGSSLTWSNGVHSGTLTLNGVSWDSVKFYCAANGDGDLTQISEYEDLKKKGAFAAASPY